MNSSQVKQTLFLFTPSEHSRGRGGSSDFIDPLPSAARCFNIGQKAQKSQEADLSLAALWLQPRPLSVLKSDRLMGQFVPEKSRGNVIAL